MSRSPTAAADKESAVRAADANLDGLRAQCNPTDGGHTEDGGSRDGYGIRTRGKGGTYGGARRVDRGYAGVAHEVIGARRGQIPHVEARSCRGVINRSLHTGISHDEVFPKEISRSSGKQDYPIRIPNNDVLLDDVAGSGGAAWRTDAEVIAWS